MPDALAIVQAGNLFVFVMGNPVFFVDPSGLTAYSVRRTSRRDHNTDTVRNVYTLYVQLRSDSAVLDVLGGLLPGFSLLSWAGLRMAGNHSISTDVSVAAGTAMDIAAKVVGGLAGFAASVTSGLGSALGSGSSITSIARAELTGTPWAPDWQIREAISNQFYFRIWQSFSRDIVAEKFTFAFISMTSLVASGSVEVRRAIDVFGPSAFGGGDRTYRLTWDAVAGRYINFRRDHFYFFPVTTSGHGAIGDIENIINSVWGEVRWR